MMMERKELFPSRLAQPSSPGCAKRKVQQKLQRDSRQQAPSPKTISNGSMKASNLQKPMVNSKLSNSKLTSPSSISQTKLACDSKLASKIKAPEQRPRNVQSPKPVAVNKIASQLHYRSSLPRLSQRNSDASSSESSNESTSSRNTPISGLASPASGIASPASLKQITSPNDNSKANMAPQAKFAMQGRAASALELKRSATFNRENVSEFSSQRKVSASGIPGLRGSKKSLDSPSLTRENTSDTIETQKISKITPAAKQRCVSTESLKIRYQSNPIDSSRGRTISSSIPNRSSQTNLSASSTSTLDRTKSKLCSSNSKALSFPKSTTAKKTSPEVSDNGPIEVQINKQLIDDFQKASVIGEKDKSFSRSSNQTSIARSPNLTKRGLAKSALPRRGSENVLDSKSKSTRKSLENMLSAQKEHMKESTEEKPESLSYPIVGKIPDALNTTGRILKLGNPPKSLNEDTLKALEPERNLKLLTSFHSNKTVVDNDHLSLSFENVDKSTPTLTTSDKESDSTCIYKLDIPDEDGEYNDSVSYNYDQSKKVMSKKITMTELPPTVETSQPMMSSTSINVTQHDDFSSNRNNPKVDPFNGICLDTCCKDETDKDINGTSKQMAHLKTTEPPRATPSPFRRINPKVAIPPPQINSISNTGEFLIANEYARTPSTDGEELYLSNYYSENSELKMKAREKAIKTWQKRRSNEGFENVKENDVENGMDYDNESMGSEEKINTQKPSNQFDDHDDMARQRHLSDGSINATNDINNVNQISGTMTLGRDKKKKSKFKKFFKKLSTKKDGNNGKIEIDGTSDYFSSNDGLSRTSTSSSNNSSSANTKSRRRSDGTLSTHSTQDFNIINNNVSLNSRRRTFLNLSFIKKATSRKRSHTYTTDYRRQHDFYTSQTVKALCSPHLPRKCLNDTSILRRGSDPSLYIIEYPISQSKRGWERKSDGLTYSRLIRTNTQRSSGRRLSQKSSVSSNDENADYANYPFSKVNMKAPKKPERNNRNGSCSDPFQNPNDSFGSSLSNDKSKADWRVQNSEKFLGSSDYRHSTTSSDASSVSDFYSSSKRSDTSGENAPLRSSSSLRRTPLRRSIDDINNVFEIHKQTIDKVAYETSMLHCTCANIQSLDWGDFERDDDLIHLGISQYMITPVRCEKDKRNYTAWLRIKKQRVTPAVTQGIDYTKTTLHRHCLHVCHMIEQKYQTPNQVGIPTSIQVDNVYISPQVPRMTLGKYASVTVEKHTKYPEIYERETALVLLQIIKALEHYYRHDVIVTTVNTENVLVLKNNDSPITLSPRHEPNKCPMIALAALPGFENAHEDSEDEEPIANVCFQLAFVLLELLHSPYHEEVGDAADMAMLLSMLPDLTIKSTYSRHLQYVINFLLTSSCDRFKTFEEMKLILGVLLFGPTEISDHDEDEAVVLINKWHNRRCLDMVAHILKEAPLIMLCASGSNTHNIENLKSFDLEIILECEFLSEVLPSDIYRISKKLNR